MSEVPNLSEVCGLQFGNYCHIGWTESILEIKLQSQYSWPQLYWFKKQRYHFANKDSYSQSYVFSSSHVWMWELNHKEGWVLKNLCFQILVLEMKTLESPLESKEIKPVNPKEDQTWIFIGRTEAEAPIPWPSYMKSWLCGKDPDSKKGWRQEEKGPTEGQMIAWHHWFSGHEFEQTLVDSGQGSLACCNPWGCKELDTTTQQQFIGSIVYL